MGLHVTAGSADSVVVDQASSWVLPGEQASVTHWLVVWGDYRSVMRQLVVPIAQSSINTQVA